MVRQRPRRRVLLGTGALAAATLGGIAVSTDNVSATVAGEYRVPDAQQSLADTTLQDVRLAVDANYSFSANAPMHGVELELHVGANDDTLDLIARHTRDDLGTDSLTGTETLNGSLMSASDFDIADFRPSNGELTRRVQSALRLYVLRDGDVAAEAAQTTTFAVSVTEEAVEVNAAVGGTGTVTFKTD